MNSGSDSGGDGDVFDKGDGACGALQPVERRDEAPGELPDELVVVGVNRHAGAGGEHRVAPQTPERVAEQLVELVFCVAVVLDQYHGLRLLGDQQLVAGVEPARHAQVAAVHQVAGAGLEGADLHRRPGRPVERLEEQQRAAHVRGQGERSEGQLGQHRQRAFAACQEPREVDAALGAEVGEAVAGGVHAGARCVAVDVVGVAGEQVVEQAAELFGRPVGLGDGPLVEKQELGVGRNGFGLFEVPTE